MGNPNSMGILHSASLTIGYMAKINNFLKQIYHMTNISKTSPFSINLTYVSRKTNQQIFTTQSQFLMAPYRLTDTHWHQSGTIQTWAIFDDFLLLRQKFSKASLRPCMNSHAGLGSRTVWGMYCLRSLGSRDRGLESHTRHRCLLYVCVYSVFVLSCV
jgi:hypothetical protein